MTEFSKNSASPAVWRRCLHDRQGSVALLFGLAIVPLLGLAGAAVDYTSASSTRGRLAQASDAAALAAARSTGLTKEQRDKIARDVFNANMGGTAMQNVTFKVKDLASGVRVEANADVKTSFMGIMGISKMPVGVFSEVSRTEGSIEIALVLDTTGSMVNDMPALRRSSANFITTIFNMGAEPGTLKVGVVPYVGAVNPGRSNLGMSSIDYFAESPHHASILKDRNVAWMENCNPWYQPPDPNPGRGGGGQETSGGGGGGGGGGGEEKKEKYDPYSGSGKGGKGVWIQDSLKKMAGIGLELFGIREAVALGETPNTRAPFTGTVQTVSPPYAPSGTKALVPAGFAFENPCWLKNPKKINHLDLFDRISGAQWKGCVEARPEPYDVTDDPPTADARTKFVPYFWPDEQGKRGEKTWAANNYMDDGPNPPGWKTDADSWENTYTLFKYNGTNAADLTAALGPNKACPDELMRLSADKNALLNKVSSLQMGIGSGTISSEGVAWGWRVLTPKLPFADGKPYDKANKKFLVLMSDGENEIGDNNPDGPVMSHYSAYGYLRDGRFGRENFQWASKYLDERFSLVCENAKAAGITVMTVYFRDNNASAKAAMKKCASENRFFFEAVNERALDASFQSIAAEISKLRISK